MTADTIRPTPFDGRTAMTPIELADLLSRPPDGPCISIYQPTHRTHPANRQDPIRFRNLLDRAQASLRESHAADRVEALLRPLRMLADDPDFWSHAADGLAVLVAIDTSRVLRLQRTVPELVVVATSFHVKPLLRIVQSADRYQMLALTRSGARLFEGNRDALDEVDVAGSVAPVAQAILDAEQAGPERQVHSYGTGPSAPGAGARRGPGGAKTGGMHHGHDAKTDRVDQQTERLFRAIDRAVMEHHSRPSGLPLILVALPEHQSPFRRISRNPLLVDAGIETDPQSLMPAALRERAWEVMAPRYLARLAGLVDRFEAARPGQLGSGELAPVARAAAEGRVATMLLDAQRRVPGRFDRITGEVSAADLADPEVDDLLDDLAEQVLRTGGEVVVVPGDRMPTDTGVAAVFRY
jgi:hypothetical protein